MCITPGGLIHRLVGLSVKTVNDATDNKTNEQLSSTGRSAAAVSSGAIIKCDKLYMAKQWH